MPSERNERGKNFQFFFSFFFFFFFIFSRIFALGPFLLIMLSQGGHTLWKTGKMVNKYSLQGKNRELENLLKIREKSGNLKKSYLCKVKIFKFYTCSDVATGGFFLPYA